MAHTASHINGQPMGWAIIGASTIAREFMVEAIRKNGGEPLWVMSNDAAHAADFAASCKVAWHGSDLSKVLADERVNAVYVSSANSRHHGQVLEAARAGKHVLCDKPLATHSADAVEMVRACEKAGVVLAVNHHLRSSRIHQAMRRMIADGEIGDVRSMMIVHAGFLRPVLQTWRIKNPAEGAIYLDLSVHDIDLARFLLQQEPMTALGMGGAVLLGVGDIHDHTMYSMAMSGGAFLQAHESFITPDVESEVRILGSQGALSAKGTLSQTAGGSLNLRKNGRTVDVAVEPVDLYVDTVSAFLQAVETGSRPLASGWDGVASLCGAEAVALSVSTGRLANVQSPMPVTHIQSRR